MQDSYRGDAGPPSTVPNDLHNLSAEQGVLGALLFDNSHWAILKDSLAAEHFFDPVHKGIYEAIGKTIDAGRVADGVSLREWARLDPGMIALSEERLGGRPAAYLLQLMENAARLTEHVIEYAEIIRDLSERRTLVQLCKDSIKLAMTPPLGADADDVLDETLKSLQKFSDTRIGVRGTWKSVRQAGDEIVAALRSPTPPGIHSGLSKLDRLLGGALYSPDLIIIAGRPAMGKTAIADNVAMNVSEGGAVVGFFSMEMSREQIAARALSRRSSATEEGFSYSQLRDRNHRPDADYVERLNKTLPQTFLIDPTGAQTVSGIRAAARSMRKQAGKLDLIMVDYLQLMRDQDARKDGRVQEVSQITADLKALAKELGVPVIALSQLSRAVESRNDKKPQLSDLRESGSIEQDADIVLFVYREHYYLERNEPQPQDGDKEGDLAARRLKHQQRLAETKNKFEIYTGKNRHAAGGIEVFYCDLAMDVILDEPPERFQNPRPRIWMDD